MAIVHIIKVFITSLVGIFCTLNGPANKANSFDALSAIVYYITDSLLGERPWLNAKTTCTFPSPWQQKAVKDWGYDNSRIQTENPENYVGTYGNVLGDKLISTEISGSIKQLVFEMGTFGGELHPAGETDCFHMEITWPVEIRTSFVDDYNVSMRIFTEFYRKNGLIDSVRIDGSVEIEYKKNPTGVPIVRGINRTDITFGDESDSGKISEEKLVLENSANESTCRMERLSSLITVSILCIILSIYCTTDLRVSY